MEIRSSSVMGIFMRFDMIDCNSMATPMETNMNKLSDFSST
jgi:hypothetical protein